MSREHHPGDSSIVLLNPSLESFPSENFLLWIYYSLTMKGERRCLLIVI